MMPVFTPQLRDFPAELGGDVKTIAPVAFIGDTEEKEESHMATVIKAAQKAAAAKPLKVKVIEPFRVLHEGVAYTGGDTLEVPNDEEHDTWVKSGWVELVKEILNEVVKPLRCWAWWVDRACGRAASPTAR
jgi:hypothetical protein